MTQKSAKRQQKANLNRHYTPQGPPHHQDGPNISTQRENACVVDGRRITEDFGIRALSACLNLGPGLNFDCLNQFH